MERAGEQGLVVNRDDFGNIKEWSDVDCSRAMALLMERMDEAVDLLTALGTQKDQTANALAKHRSHWMLYAKVERDDLKSDTMREAWMIDQCEGTEELMLQADLSESLYKDQTMRCRMMMSQAEMLRSMLRSARDSMDNWSENRNSQAQRERR